jgi:hypothetical protein
MCPCGLSAPGEITDIGVNGCMEWIAVEYNALIVSVSVFIYLCILPRGLFYY